MFWEWKNESYAFMNIKKKSILDNLTLDKMAWGLGHGGLKPKPLVMTK